MYIDNSLHSIKLTLALDETSNSSIRHISKTWSLRQSPFWYEFHGKNIKGEDETVAYPILPFPGTKFSSIYLNEDVRIDFEISSKSSLDIVPSEKNRFSAGEIRAITKLGSVRIRRKEDAFKTVYDVTAEDTEMFRQNGWT